MSKQPAKRAKQKRSNAQKAESAAAARKIEQEFPPGQAGPPPDDATEPATLGDYFDLRFVVGELRREREAQGLSLRDIQQRTGIERSAINRLENAENVNPTINTLTRYARALGLRIDIRLAEVNPEQTAEQHSRKN